MPPLRGPNKKCWKIFNAACAARSGELILALDEQLLAELKDWRLKVSKDMSVPAYVVFTDNTLIAIAESLPTDDAALVAIPGIGARKLEQFGPDVLAMVRDRQGSR